MTKDEALYQSLAASGATLIAFIGLCHEVAGHILFPWGPAFLGGPVGWHATGLSVIAIGLLMLCGAIDLIEFPLVLVSLAAAAAVSSFFLVIAAALYEDFHVFALAGSIAGCATAFCQRRRLRIARGAVA